MNPTQKPLKEEMIKLAEKHDIPVEKIEEIERAMWDFVRTEIARGSKDNTDSFENIYLRYLGTFHTKKSIINHVSANYDKNN